MTWLVSVRTLAIPGATSSPCRRASTTVDSATTVSPSCSATVTAGVAVSRASRSTLIRLVGLCGGQVQVRPSCANTAQSHRADVLSLVARFSMHDDFEALLGEALDFALSPFHNGDSRFERSLQVQVVNFDIRPEPVCIDVNKCRSTGERRMHPSDDECRRSYGTADAEAIADALRERGLASSKLAGQNEQVAWSQERGECASKFPRGVGRWDRERRLGGWLLGHGDLAVRLPRIVRLRRDLADARTSAGDRTFCARRSDRSSSSRSRSFTMSGYSSTIMCPQRSSTCSSAPGTTRAMSRLCSAGVR